MAGIIETRCAWRKEYQSRDGVIPTTLISLHSTTRFAASPIKPIWLGEPLSPKQVSIGCAVSCSDGEPPTDHFGSQPMSQAPGRAPTTGNFAGGPPPLPLKDTSPMEMERNPYGYHPWPGPAVAGGQAGQELPDPFQAPAQPPRQPSQSPAEEVQPKRIRRNVHFTFSQEHLRRSHLSLPVNAQIPTR